MNVDFSSWIARYFNFKVKYDVEHITCYDMWYFMSLVMVEMHLETGLQLGPSWIRRIWRSFLVRSISNFGTVNFGTPQHSRNHSNHSFNRLKIVSKAVITLESRKITSRLLELSKANRFYISEQGPLWKVLNHVIQLIFNDCGMLLSIWRLFYTGVR